jgi:hypothetical protein
MKKERRRPMTVQAQLGEAYEKFMSSQPEFGSFEDFLRAAGIPANKIESK